MGKKTKITECVYCGWRKETTRDHVISRNLFPSSYKKKNVITAPCCEECNKGFSFDEEYFRDVVVVSASSLGHSKYADDLFFSKVKRSIQRRPQIGFKLTNQMVPIDLSTKTGIYLGKWIGIHISGKDRKRVDNVLDKYIKGLFFHEFKRIFPSDYKIKHIQGTGKMERNLGIINKWNLNNKEIFAYGYNFVPETYESAWVTVFYDSIFFVSVVASEKFFYIHPKSQNKPGIIRLLTLCHF